MLHCAGRSYRRDEVEMERVEGAFEGADVDSDDENENDDGDKC